MTIQQEALTPIIKAPSRLPALDSKTEQGLKQVAQAFESLLVQMLLDQMGEVAQGAMFGSGHSAHIYQGMFVENMAEHSAKSGGIGLQKMFLDQLRRMAIGGQPAVHEEMQNEQPSP